MTDKKNPNMPRTFLSRAYLVEIEPHTFGLFRHIEMEEKQKDGNVIREKVGKPLGPIGVFRACEGDEKPDLRTVHPSTMQELNLKRIS